MTTAVIPEEVLNKVAAYLCASRIVKTQELIMAEKRVDVFKGSFATRALLSPSYLKLKNVPKVETAEEAAELLQKLQDGGYFLRAKPMNNNSRFLQPDLTRTWSDDALYAWVYQGTQTFTLLLSGVLVIFALACFMFPLWPVGVRSRASFLLNYGMYIVLGIVAFLLLLSVIRVVFFGITYFSKYPGIWIFPNLWEDCGVLESFRPLWAWHRPAAVETNNSQAQKKDQ